MRQKKKKRKLKRVSLFWLVPFVWFCVYHFTLTDLCQFFLNSVKFWRNCSAREDPWNNYELRYQIRIIVLCSRRRHPSKSKVLFQWAKADFHGRFCRTAPPVIQISQHCLRKPTAILAILHDAVKGLFARDSAAVNYLEVFWLDSVLTLPIYRGLRLLSRLTWILKYVFVDKSRMENADRIVIGDLTWNWTWPFECLR